MNEIDAVMRLMPEAIAALEATGVNISLARDLRAVVAAYENLPASPANAPKSISMRLLPDPAGGWGGPPYWQPVWNGSTQPGDAVYVLLKKDKTND